MVFPASMYMTLANKANIRPGTVISFATKQYLVAGIAAGYGLDDTGAGVRFPEGVRHFPLLHYD
jgi:hypothetical protein